MMKHYILKAKTLVVNPFYLISAFFINRKTLLRWKDYCYFCFFSVEIVGEEETEEEQTGGGDTPGSVTCEYF